MPLQTLHILFFSPEVKKKKKSSTRSVFRAHCNRIKTSQKIGLPSLFSFPVNRLVATPDYYVTEVRGLYGLEDCMCCKIEILLQHTKSPLEWKRLKYMLMLMKFPKLIFTQVKIHLHTCLALQQPGEKEKHILCQPKDISLCFCGNHHPCSPSWLLI